MDQAIKFATGNVLDQLGKDGTFYHNSNTFDPSTGETTETTSSETVKAILSQFDQTLVDGTTIQRDDLKALISANEFSGADPETDDEFEDTNGNTYKVISVTTQLIEHEPVSFQLQLRQ